MTGIAMTERQKYTDPDEPPPPEEILAKFREDITRKVRANADIVDIKAVIDRASSFAKARGIDFDIHFRDNLGYSMLGIAVRHQSMPLILMLLHDYDYQVNEELIIAVEVEFREAIVEFHRRDNDLVNRAVLAGTIYKPGASPVLIASLNEKEHMLKFLFSLKAEPLNIPVYRPQERRNIIRFDAIYETLTALSKPLYLCIMNDDPIMIAFNISERCRDIGAKNVQARDEMEMISKNCEDFADDFIKHVATFDDLELLLDQMTTEKDNQVYPGKPWERLQYAMRNNHMKFVSNGNIQKFITKKFLSGPLALNDFQSRNTFIQVLYLLTLVMLTPVWIFIYMFIPVSTTPLGEKIRGFMEMPLMRYLVQLTSYVLLCAVAINVTIHTTDLPLTELQHLQDWSSVIRTMDDVIADPDARPGDPIHFVPRQLLPMMRNDYMKQVVTKVDGLNSQTFANSTTQYVADFYIFVWTLGNTYQELQIIYVEGFMFYNDDWVNTLNMILNGCMLTSTILKYSNIFSLGGYTPQDLWSTEVAYPQTLADTIRSFGILLLVFKSYKMLRMTSLIGKPQYLLGEAFSASLYFFILFFCSLFAFSVSINGIIQNSYRQYWLACYHGIQDLTSVPCKTRAYDGDLEEMKELQSIFGVLTDFFWAMFQTDARLQFNFPLFINPQELVTSLVFALYAFFMIVVRLNILISLIIFAVLEACRREDEIFKFRRTVLFFTYIASVDPIPAPFNIVPSVRAISKHIQSKKDKPKKHFTDEELDRCARTKDLIKRLKSSYLRELRQKSSGTKEMLGAKQLVATQSDLLCRCNELISGVEGVRKQVEEMTVEKNKKRRAATSAADGSAVKESIVNNQYMMKLKGSQKIINANSSGLSSMLGSGPNS